MEESNIQDDAALMAKNKERSPSHEAPSSPPSPPEEMQPSPQLGLPPPDPNANRRRQSLYERQMGQYIGTLIVLIVLLFLYIFVEPPFQSTHNDNAIIFGLLFVSTQILRVLMACCISRRVYLTGYVSPTIVQGYITYLILAFGIFVAQNVFAYIAIGSLQLNGFELLLVFTLALGYVIYYIVLIVIFCILPIILCMCCCCPRAFAQSARGWRPTPQNILSRLTRTQFSAQTHELMKECIICQVDFKDGDNLITLNCDARHYFHADCIETWLRQNGICPICRTPAVAQR